MMRSCHRSLFGAALVAAALLAPGAVPAADPARLHAALDPDAGAARHLRYEAYWGGLHAADFVLSLERGDDGMSAGFRLRTQGFADWILGLRVDATSRARLEADELHPEGYRVEYRNRRRHKAMALDFLPPDGIAEPRIEFDRSDDPEPPDAPIEAEHRTGVIDPLGALAESLRRLAAHVAAHDGIAPTAGDARFVLPVYDGRRRFDLHGAAAGSGPRTILGTTHDTYRLRLTTKPVAGFNDRHRVLWDGSEFDLYVSTDGRFVPLQINAVGNGPVIHLVRECATAAACAPAAD